MSTINPNTSIWLWYEYYFWKEDLNPSKLNISQSEKWSQTYPKGSKIKMFVLKSLHTHAYSYIIILQIKKNELPKLRNLPPKIHEKSFESDAQKQYDIT